MTLAEDSPVHVMFRREAGGGVLAVFPYLDEEDGCVACYAHLGQHAATTWRYVTRGTRPAAPDEYASLKAELEGAPYRYRLIVVKRRRAGGPAGGLPADAGAVAPGR
jgi:hypothetical protein